MRKIYELIKDPLTGKINIRVKLEHAAAFTQFLISKGYKCDSDGRDYPHYVVNYGNVTCRPFLLDYSDDLRRDVCDWDLEE